MDSDDPFCMYSVAASDESLDDVIKMLDPEHALDLGCRVHKEAGCCILCANNDDCSRIPMHVNCRCTREMFLTATE